eukprot:XP_014010697.1 PREDICTED: uncharacterized protein LOC106577281 [Salmo salar]
MVHHSSYWATLSSRCLTLFQSPPTQEEGLILLFYLVFYIFLGGMFVLTMYVMLLTLDDYKPTYQDRLVTPGMMIRPRGEAMEILYNTLTSNPLCCTVGMMIRPRGEAMEILYNTLTSNPLCCTVGMMIRPRGEAMEILYNTLTSNPLCCTVGMMIRPRGEAMEILYNTLTSNPLCCTVGMMIRPRGEAMEILYNTKDTESFDIYAQTLNNFLEFSLSIH